MTGSSAQWDVELRPRLISIVAYVAAFIVATAGIAVGIFSKIKFTGAYIHTTDQFAMAILGILLAAGILLLAMPRVRIGPAGIGVRNVLLERVVPWDEVVDVSFPEGSRWARVDIADFEYVPVVAIQAVDGERAVEAMETVRALLATYRPDLTRS